MEVPVSAQEVGLFQRLKLPSIVPKTVELRLKREDQRTPLSKPVHEHWEELSMEVFVSAHEVGLFQRLKLPLIVLKIVTLKLKHEDHKIQHSKTVLVD